MTNPALQPERLMVINGSSAIFRPTLLIHTSERLPSREQPNAISSAVFSLLVQAIWTSFWVVDSTRLSITYVAGEPG
jgi:hypothetical protein